MNVASIPVKYPFAARSHVVGSEGVTVPCAQVASVSDASLAIMICVLLPATSLVITSFQTLRSRVWVTNLPHPHYL